MTWAQILKWALSDDMTLEARAMVGTCILLRAERFPPPETWSETKIAALARVDFLVQFDRELWRDLSRYEDAVLQFHSAAG